MTEYLPVGLWYRGTNKDDLLRAMLRESYVLKDWASQRAVESAREALECGDDLMPEITELARRCDDATPPYTFFGQHPGAKDQWGVWPDIEALKSFEGLLCRDQSEIPEEYSGLALVVNNWLTLYDVEAGFAVEVWTVPKYKGD